ncbi:porin [Roseateles koreensis]|uniref:Porin n=1 Tax=Roseateles koreensis TaxID=2987526 RepID=A0ABT5KPU2_9BURK|nr:porin [Roseateles koreensis]MDC8784388.1 porin [Roseateles koreensis]
MCAALITLAGVAQAQSVNIYGLIDVGVEHISKVGASGANLTRVPSNTGTLPSRLGFRGNEDLGNGMNAVFTLEMGLAPDQGTLGQGGRAFGRQAFVGLSGGWGAVTLGRQYTMLYWSLMDADILGPSVFSAGSLDAYLPNARHDNALVYRGRFGGLSVGASYSLGRDTVNAGPSPVGTNCPGESTDTKACRAWSAMVKYDSDSWGAALAYDTGNGRTVGAAPDAIFGGLTSSSKSDSRLTINGYAKLGEVKLGAGVIRRTNDGDAIKPKSDLWFVGASYPVNTSLSAEAAYMGLRYTNVSQRDSSILAARLVYKLSMRTAVYGQVGAINNDALAAVSVSGGAPGSNPVAGASQTGLSLGVRHSF